MFICAFLTIETGFHFSYEVLEHSPEALGIIFLELWVECMVGSGVDPSELWELLPKGEGLREVWVSMRLIQFGSQDKYYSFKKFIN